MQTVMTSTFPERLRIILEETGIRQTDLCEKTGIGKSAMSQYLHGAFVPKQQKLNAIAEALGVSEGWLMGYDVPRFRKIYQTDDGGCNYEGEAEYIEMTAYDDSMQGAHIPKDAKVIIRVVGAEVKGISDGEIVGITVKGERPKLRILHKDGDKLIFTATDAKISPQVFTEEALENGILKVNGIVSRVEIEFLNK